MSIENFDTGSHSEKKNQPLVSRELARALNHCADIELGNKPEVYGTVLSQAAHFSLFPLSKVAGTEWTRENPWGHIAIDAGRLSLPSGKSKRAPIPAGGLPRLLTAYITSEARRVRAAGGDPSRLDLTDSLNAMVKVLGLSEGSRNTALMRALEATLTARVVFTREEEEIRNGRPGKWSHMIILPSIANKVSLWVPNSSPLEGFEPYIHLSSDYLNLILNDDLVIPARLDILAQLVGKPMAMDVLLWLQNVVYSLHRGNRTERFFTWQELYGTMTHDYAAIRNFVTNWKQAFKVVHPYYPEVRVELVRGTRSAPGGVKVLHSPLLIDEKRRQIS